jgi:amidophosphoribosyltransferase
MHPEAGAKDVQMSITSAPINFPCFYGIDTPNRGELIASSHSLEEIRRYLKADSLAYLSIEAMEEEIRKSQTFREGESPEKGTYCKACFDGNYPIAFTHEERVQHGLFDRQPLLP